VEASFHGPVARKPITTTLWNGEALTMELLSDRFILHIAANAATVLGICSKPWTRFVTIKAESFKCCAGNTNVIICKALINFTESNPSLTKNHVSFLFDNGYIILSCHYYRIYYKLRISVACFELYVKFLNKQVSMIELRPQALKGHFKVIQNVLLIQLAVLMRLAFGN
jgi:hypothetical protein